MLDHERNLRIGQRSVAPTPGIQILSVLTQPEDGYRGQMIFLADTYELKVFDGSAWITTASGGGGGAVGTRTFVTSTEPAADNIGDLWLVPGTYNLNVWDGIAWQEVKDPDVDSAVQAAADAHADANLALGQIATLQTEVDSKTVTFYQVDAPLEATENDLWFNTLTNRLFRHNGDTVGDPWQEIVDQAIVDATADIGELGALVDEKTTTYYSTWEMRPLNLGPEDVGDLLFVSDQNNEAYMWWGGTWTSVRDQAIPALQTEVATKVTTYYGNYANAPLTATEGDLFYAADQNNKLYMRRGGLWAEMVIGNAAITTTAMDNKTITGALVQTSATSSRGIKISGSAGTLKAFDNNGVERMSVNSSSGDLTITGNFRTSPSGARVELTDEDTTNPQWGTGDSGATASLHSNGGQPAKLNYRVEQTGGWAYTLLHAGGYSSARPYISMVDDGLNEPRLTIAGAIWLSDGGLRRYMQSGRINITPSGASVNTTVAINFSWTMAGTPNVSLGFGTGVSSDLYCHAWATSTSSTGFNLTLRRGNTTQTTVYWTAIVPQ